MASKDQERWRTEPEVTASGGHLSSSGAGGLFDPLNDPMPSDAAKRERSEPTRERPRVDPTGEQRSATEPIARTARARNQGAPRRRPGLRRVRRTVRHVDPFSVLKLSLFFYACLLILWLLFLAGVYSFVSGLGVFDRVSDFCKDLVLDSCAQPLSLGTVERWGLVIGFVFAVVGSLVNTLMAFLYNVGADLLGGLELTFVERDS